MRIIAGSSRGRKLFAPEGEDTRPTADRIRESVFQILSTRLEGAAVLDLFAGSGALALEALSRGAAYAVINDVSRKSVDAIGRNVEAVGVRDRVRVLALDYRKAIATLDMCFSLVFIDPPYRMVDCYAEAAEALLNRALLTEGAVIVMERAKTVKLCPPRGFRTADERIYGDTAVSFWELEEYDRTLSRQL